MLSPGLQGASPDHYYNYDANKKMMDDHLENIRNPDAHTKITLYNPLDTRHLERIG